MEIRSLYAVETVVCRGTQLLLYKLKCFCMRACFKRHRLAILTSAAWDLCFATYFSTNTSSPFSTFRSLTLLGNFS